MKLLKLFTEGTLAALTATYVAVGAAIGLVFLVVPILKETLPATLHIPTMIVLVAAGAYVALFVARHDAAANASQLRDQLTAFTDVRPRITFFTTRWTPLYGRLPGDGPNVHSTYVFHVLQLWLKNVPERRTESSAARNVSVAVAMFNQGQVVVPQFTSQWILSTDPDLAGYGNHQSTIDIPANDVPAKLNLILQHPETDADCYAFSFGKLDGNPDGKYPPFRLVPGRYRCDVTLRGDNLDQTISFRLTNSGTITSPALVPEA